VGNAIEAPVPLPKAPVLEIVGQEPAAVPTIEYGPEPVTETAVHVGVFSAFAGDVVKPLRL
jgi:hypothetical protein